MENFVIEESSHLPLIDFKVNGKLKMEGKCVPENVISYFQPLIDFVTEIATEELVFDVNLIYFNTASSKMLMDLFRHIDANNKIDSAIINWHFEEGDEDSVEMAEIYEESCLRLQFRYHEYAEVAV